MRKSRGFTLIELMIAAGIVAILASIAYPSYQNYVRRGARAQAQAAMMDAAQKEERYYTSNNTYVQMTSSSVPNGFQNYSGSDSASRKYDITVGAKTGGTLANGFLVTATPANGFSDPDCGILTLDNLGVKGVGAGTVAACWK